MSVVLFPIIALQVSGSIPVGTWAKVPGHKSGRSHLNVEFSVQQGAFSSEIGPCTIKLNSLRGWYEAEYIYIHVFM